MSKKKTQKITTDELGLLNSQQSNLSEALHRVGVIEAEKHGLLHSISYMNEQIAETKVELEKKYGPVSINLATGEYKKNEDVADKKD